MHHALIAQEKSKTEYPHYKIDVSYDHDKTLLVGKMQVRFSRIEYPDHELLFALPGNRFLYPDTRGLRKHKIVPVFSLRRFPDNLEDPKSPKGFSHGNMKILSVITYKDKLATIRKKLDYNIENNPDLEVGYSREQGLLRIFLKEKLSDFEELIGKSIIEIEFSIKFPENLYEGSLNGMLITSNWHPKLLNWRKDGELNLVGWETDGNNPSPSTFEVNLRAIQSGKLITTSGDYNFLSGQLINLPLTKKPLKKFPLIFSDFKKKMILEEKSDIFPKIISSEKIIRHKVKSFYFEDQKRKGELILNWTKSFVRFLKVSYGMVLPWETIYIVPVEAEYEQVEVINNIVLVPIPNYKRSELMDRQAFGFLTRSLGKLWFGESVWNNQDNQLWLNFGVPAFLGLRFFQYNFGNDAGIFGTIDWLNPLYKDHYYEDMVNDIPPKMKYPILSSFRKNPNSQSFLQALTYKTAMVISMLESILGERVFRKGLKHFASEYNQKIVSIKEFQMSFEKYNIFFLRNPLFKELEHYNIVGQESLEWFFSQWFKTVKTLDYSFEEFKTIKLQNGFFETEVKIKKIGSAKMPFESVLTTTDGKEFRKMSSGIAREEILYFITKSYPEKFSIDPEEKLMETSRINNHSFNYYRVRFVFDWKKDRDHLVLVVPGFGNNSIDGNSLGLGVRYGFGNYRIFAIPGYGTKNKRMLYIFNLDKKNMVFHGLEGGFSFYEFGGVQSQGLRATFEPPKNPGELGFKLNTRFSREKLFASGGNAEKSGFSETGESNAFLIEYTGNFRPNDYYEIMWNIWNEQPALSLDSDFSYVRGQSTLGQVFRVGHRKLFELDVIRSMTSGESPLQKKFQLGGPNVLRGFPQHTDLSDDHLLASRLGFKFPLIDSPFWGIVSTFKIQGTIFIDQGKIWSDRISFNKLKYRKSAGVGLEWTLDTVSLFQIPLKLEVAFPIDDKDYKKPQFIFLGVLTGS